MAKRLFVTTQSHDLDHAHNPPHFPEDLLSAKGRPSPEEQAKTVLICVHGFSGTPFDYSYLLDYLQNQSDDILASQVMMGGHGHDIQTFKSSRWQDWQTPVEQEIDALQALGYKNLVLLTASTGGAICLELLSRKLYHSIRKLVMVAPIVEPRRKLMRQVHWLSKCLPIESVASSFDEDWTGNWFRELPVHCIVELDKLTRKLRKQLKQGLRLPENWPILIVQSRFEPIVDHRSALLLADGLVNNHVEVLMLNSKWHLPILPRKWSGKENQTKTWVYQKIESFVLTPDPS